MRNCRVSIHRAHVLLGRMREYICEFFDLMHRFSLWYSFLSSQMVSQKPELYDVAIIGAGPAGSTCALALRHSGLKVVVVDKAAFPRDKVCGDAIPARAEKVLHSIDPVFGQALANFPQTVAIRGCRVVAPNRNHFDYHFHIPGYCSTRLHFDDFLLQLAGDHASFSLLESTSITHLQRSTTGWDLSDKTGVRVSARMVVGCDGANSIVARQLAGFQVDHQHHCGAVRGYYHGLSDLPDQKMEIHFLEDHLPGYFWIFPLPDGWANVGFGMLSHQISDRKVNLRKSLARIVEHAPGLAERFATAELQGTIRGFGLPMGSRQVPLSGSGFLLCGDAAALVEPATGEGIGNAMLSGQLAADHVMRAFQQDDFSADNLKAYDKALYGRIWKDLRRKYLAQKYLGERRRLMNWLVNQANRPGPVRWMMKQVF